MADEPAEEYAPKPDTASDGSAQETPTQETPTQETPTQETPATEQPIPETPSVPAEKPDVVEYRESQEPRVDDVIGVFEEVGTGDEPQTTKPDPKE